MGLLQNGFRDSVGAMRYFGAGVSNGAYPYALVANRARTAAMRNLTAGEGITDDTVGIPYGYRAPGAWLLPQKAGALSSHNIVTGAGAVADLNLAGGLNAEAALAGVGDMSGTGALIVSLAAALSGTGTISSATADAFLNLAASLAGAGDLTGALNALGHAAAVLSGSGTVSAVTATAIGTLAASITVTGDLVTTANIGAAVWDYILSCGYTAEEAMQILTAVAAGKSTVTDLGGGLANVIFRDLQDVQDVVDADMTGSERTTVTLDP